MFMYNNSENDSKFNSKLVKHGRLRLKGEHVMLFKYAPSYPKFYSHEAVQLHMHWRHVGSHCGDWIVTTSI